MPPAVTAGANDLLKAGKSARLHCVDMMPGEARLSSTPAKGVCGIILPAMNTNLITSDPAVMMGKPVVAGTRITVEHILEKLAAGETIEQITEAHPRLTREAVLAALSYAAQ